MEILEECDNYFKVKLSCVVDKTLDLTYDVFVSTTLYIFEVNEYFPVGHVRKENDDVMFYIGRRSLFNRRLHNPNKTQHYLDISSVKGSMYLAKWDIGNVLIPYMYFEV